MNQASPISSCSLVSCFASWLGISALLMAPALAQVNGPGPSPANLFDAVLNLPGDEAVITGGNDERVGGVSGETTQLNVNDNGAVGTNFTAVSSSEVNISGGIVGRDFGVSGSEVNISGGTIGRNFNAASGSQVNISGGNIGDSFAAIADSEVNISGGTVGNEFEAFSASEVNISGGTFGRGFFVFGGGSVPGFPVFPASDVELIGGEFRLNGADFSGGTITLANNDVFTGTFADGSSFVFFRTGLTSSFNDSLINVNLTEAALPAADLVPIVINAPGVNGPSGLRTGQTLTLEAGGSLGDDFEIVGATLNVDGGDVGDGAEAVDSVVNISGGTVGGDFFALSDSEVNISGGTIGRNFNAYAGSVVNISGDVDVGFAIEGFAGSVVNITGGALPRFIGESGEVNISGGTVTLLTSQSVFGLNIPVSVVNITGDAVVDRLDARFRSVVNISGGTVGVLASAFNGSVVNISGGTVGDRFGARSGGVVNVSGGTFGDQFTAFSGGEVNIFGSAFTIDGAALDTLVAGNAFTITDRDVTLSGLLADGEPFSFDLNSLESVGNDSFAPDATLTVTLGSPTGPVILGDVNQDGVVDFSDIPAFIAILMAGGFQAEADVDQSGVVDFSDIPAFIAILMAS